ncbi:hypothetical protein GALMADRAFT_244205 [Galerina marginata CBS 339.88]|uniref:Transmembrane protein 53 n=1 Tax=Galerina marginata (strain CBS 339.88) TaxID=685588 RepID=A0A067TI95_GALM3|nr:hypothetical protein GALMADRAFT_244205 [Galerina marginata CBS 339.88]
MADSGVRDTGLISIGKGIYLHKPLHNANHLENLNSKGRSQLAESLQPPTFILIFTWMGAKVPHLLKYSNVYSEIYPESTQIIVRSEPSFFWGSKSTKEAHLQPVVEALELLGCLPPVLNCSKLVREATIEPILPYPAPRVLVHAFSNGGSWQLSTLGDILSCRARSSQYATVKFLPTALVLDSCPGHGGINGTLRAFSGVIRSPILRGVAKFVIRLIYLYVALRRKFSFSRPRTALDHMKARLQSVDLLPWFSEDTPRLYLYSMKDDVVPYHEVEKHAEQTRALGFLVTQEKFADSPHVAHAKVYPQQYWGAIQTLWESASRVKEVTTSDG